MRTEAEVGAMRPRPRRLARLGAGREACHRLPLGA